jgi:hypothetical protein
VVLDIENEAVVMASQKSTPCTIHTPHTAYAQADSRREPHLMDVYNMYIKQRKPRRKTRGFQHTPAAERLWFLVYRSVQKTAGPARGAGLLHRRYKGHWGGGACAESTQKPLIQLLFCASQQGEFKTPPHKSPCQVFCPKKIQCLFLRFFYPLLYNWNFKTTHKIFLEKKHTNQKQHPPTYGRFCFGFSAP